MGNKPTPGPWKISSDASHPANIRITSTCRRHIAKVYAENMERDEVCEANAALIIAAPDLLAALQTVIRFREGRDEFNFQRLPKDQRDSEYYDKWQEVEATVRAAIRKAEGGNG